MMDTFAVLLVQLAIAGAVAVTCGILAKRKNRDSAFWAAFGMVATFLIWVPIGIMAGWGPFLGALAGGVATIAVLASMAPLAPCPICGGPILPTARTCQYCGGKLHGGTPEPAVPAPAANNEKQRETSSDVTSAATPEVASD